MGAWGAALMGFFGGVFAALTMHWQWHVAGVSLVYPFLISALIGLMAAYVIRLPGQGIALSERAEKAILWSSVAEGVGLFLAVNIAVNFGHLEWRLPAMALIVGLHFLPIAIAASFRPFHALGAALILSAIAGFAFGAPMGGEISGIMAAVSLWIAALLAVARDRRTKRATAPAI